MMGSGRTQFREGFPDEFKEKKRWFELYGSGKTDLKKGWNDSKNWKREKDFTPEKHIAFEVCGTDYLFIDFDHCIKDGVIAPEVKSIIDNIKRMGNTFFEISLSNTGAHAFIDLTGCCEDIPEISNDSENIIVWMNPTEYEALPKQKRDAIPKIELFFHTGGRYVYLTGKHDDYFLQAPIVKGKAAKDIYNYLVRIREGNHTLYGYKNKADPVLANSSLPTSNSVESAVSNLKLKEIAEVMKCIPPDNYDEWMHVGYSLRNSFGDEAYPVWTEWSSKSAKYKPEEMQKKWLSFNGTSQWNCGTIYKLAKQYGWTDNHQNEPKATANKYSFEPLLPAPEYFDMNLPKLKVFVGVGEDVPLLVEGTCILSAKSKLGKSWFSLELCDAISKGNDFLGYKTNQCSTLYLDLETKKNLKEKRLEKLKSNVGDVSKKFYIQNEAHPLGAGFTEMIEFYLEQDPDIGVVVVDVYQKIKPKKKATESDYDFEYHNLGLLNPLAEKYHLSIILICHDRKSVDSSDPFSNILGSTGLQGASDQMIVLYKNKHNDKVVTLAAKGRTIDGIVEMQISMKDGLWRKESASDLELAARIQRKAEYFDSDIRTGVIEILKHNVSWKGRCTSFIEEAAKYGVGIEESAKEVGKFFTCNIGLFAKDKITIEKIDNGSGSKMYRFMYFTVDTVDNELTTVDENPFKH